ncbi:MAG: hypothetical protein ACYC0V_19965 [Armatimonadota bacterium]
MKLEPDANADIQDSETDYLMDIGKGVLLAIAKLKLLDESLDSSSSELKNSVLSQLDTMGQEISKSIATLEASASKDSIGLAQQLEHLDKQLSIVAASSTAEVVGLISTSSDRSQQDFAQVRRDICAAITEASLQLAKRNEEISGKVDVKIVRMNDQVITSEQANRKFVQELINSLENRSQEARNGIAKVFTQQIDDLRRWLLWLTLLTVLISGSCVAMLVLQILK